MLTVKMLAYWCIAGITFTMFTKHKAQLKLKGTDLQVFGYKQKYWANSNFYMMMVLHEELGDQRYSNSSKREQSKCVPNFMEIHNGSGVTQTKQAYLPFVVMVTMINMQLWL